PYTFQWDNGAGTAEDPSGLGAGTYMVTVTDNNACEITASALIGEPTALIANATGETLLCNGDLDGDIDLIVNGGTAPYTFQWDNGAGTAEDPSGLGAGTYMVTVTDNNACETTASAIIDEPTLLTANGTGETLLCAGDLDGDIDLTVSGGTAPYTFQWDNGAGTDEDPSGLGAGTYMVTITDNNACETTASAIIDEPTILLANAMGETLLCNGDLDGDIDLTVTGGAAPYTYQWDNGAGTDEDPFGLGSGTFVVTVTDNNACEITASALIDEPTLLTASATGETLFCNGDLDGAISLMVSGGSPPYTYQWDNGSTDEDPTGLSSGIYMVTVTDDNACEVTASALIDEPALLTASTIGETLLCAGDLDGAIALTVSGGSPPYTYQWDNGSTDEDPTGLPSGSYVVTVTDNNACEATASALIDEPTPLVASAIGETLLCAGDLDGAIALTVSGGSPPYTYQWDNGSTNEDPSGLGAGIYTITISDLNTCTVTANALIDEPNVLAVSLLGSTPADCTTCNGTANLTIDGGTPPYTYQWSNGNTNNLPTDLCSGLNAVTVTDNNGCAETLSLSIPSVNNLVVDPIVETQSISCNSFADGVLSITVNMGQAPYTYAWDDPATQNGSSATGLGPGTYTVTVTDAFACAQTETFVLTEPDVLGLSISLDANVSCNGSLDGAATATVSGGTTPFTYNWSTGASDGAVANLPAGSASLTVTDANACFVVSTVDITEPAALDLMPTLLADVSCNGDADGAANVTATGGAIPYTFSWSNGTTTAQNDNLPADTYVVTVTDSNGCFNTTSVVVSEPMVLSLSLTADAEVSCFGFSDGQATVTPTGGTLDYTYTWDSGETTPQATNLNAGLHEVTVTDANSCFTIGTVNINEPSELFGTVDNTSDANCTSCDGTATISTSGGTGPYTYLWSNGNTDQNPADLCSGMNNVSITDANACLVVLTASIGNTSSLLIDQLTVDANVSCNGDADGQLTALVSGGQAPYTYQWDDPALQTTPTSTGLSAGSYNITVMDADGCIVVDVANITEPQILSSSLSADVNPSCFSFADGQASAIISGGTMPYTYSWSNGATTEVASNLTAGTVGLTVTDMNGCLLTDNIDLIDPPAIALTILPDNNVSCNGFADGAATANASGGTLPYTWTWSNGGTMANNMNLTAGTQALTVTDANGCFSVQTLVVSEPAQLQNVMNPLADVSCETFADGAAEAQANGGTMPYTYLWSNGETTSIATALSAGNVTVTITDANACLITDNIQINEPSALSGMVDNTTPANCTSCDGTASISITGGTAPYTYSWTNGNTDQNPADLCSGVNEVTVTDANACAIMLQATVGNTSTLLIDQLIVDANVSCNSDADGVLSAVVSGGQMPYTFNWDDPAMQTTSSITGLTAGTYNLTVQDADGCLVVDVATVTEPLVLSSSLSADVNPSCNGFTDGEASAIITGGTMPYTYSWSNGSTTSTADNLGAGTASLTVIDANGCSILDDVGLTEPPAITITLSLDADVSCNTFNDGAASASAIGGSIPYTWLWSNGVTTATNNTLTAGVQSCTVTDANGCFSVQAVNINEPTLLQTTMNLIADVSCESFIDGSAEAITTGGTMPYTYAWDNGETMAIASMLNAATHSITVTDANNCSLVSTIDIAEPSGLILSVDNINPANCSSCDGSATATISGGVAPYQFSWTSGSTDQMPTNLCSGINEVTVTDTNGCTIIESFNVGNISTLDSDVGTGIDVSCFGANDGAASVVVTGGQMPYTYLWDDPNTQTSATATGLSGGLFSVTVQDANGCLLARQITLNEPAALSSTIGQDQAISCNSFTDGVVTVVVTGGTLPYTYSWSNGGTDASATGLAAGQQTLTITDNNGCVLNDQITLSEPPAIDLLIALDQEVTCNGFADGQASAAASGGILPFTYLWDNGETTALATALDATDHTLTVTDANGCFTSGTINIPEPAALNLTVDNLTEVSCNGFSDGGAEITVTGGTTPYTYTWDNGETTAQATALNAGPHSLSITDNNNCFATTTVTILEPPAMVLSVNNINPANCSACDGSAIANISGGLPPYQFSWTSGSTDQMPSDLCSGINEVTVTDDNGCTVTESFNVGNISTLDSDGATGTDVSCFGANDATATIIATGGQMPYTYQWDDPVMQSTATATGLTPGLYNVTVEDINGCSIVRQITLSEPDALTNTINLDQAISCFGFTDGQLSAITAGGTLPYTYNWSSGSTNIIANGLGAGLQTLTITDANGCELLDQFDLGEPTELGVVLDLNQDASCNGFADGQATGTPFGGTLPYTYAWDNGETTALATALDATNHNLTLTDANGCIVVSTINISEPDPLVVDEATNESVSCNGFLDGAASVTVSGGTSPYTYAWDNGETTAQATMLDAGTHSITVTDNNSCTTAIDINISEPPALVLTVDNISPANCSACDGTAFATISGGVPPYQFIWTSGSTDQMPLDLCSGNNEVTVTDANSCIIVESFLVGNISTLDTDGSTAIDVSCFAAADGQASVAVIGGEMPYTYTWDDPAMQTTATATGLSGGLYSVTVQDIDGCSLIRQLSLFEPAELVVAAVETVPVLCQGESDGVSSSTVTGGTAPYTYTWDNGETTANASMLDPGLTSLTVVDANLCETSTTVLMSSPPNPIVLAIDGQTPSNCSSCDGTADLNATGGNPPYTYAWDNGNLNEDPSDLCVGFNTVTVTDANGCQEIISVNIGNTSSLVITDVSIDQSISCNGICEGAVAITPFGGQMPYTYQWDDPAMQTTATATGLCAGSYFVSLSDADGCLAVENVIITEPDLLVATAMEDQGVLCFGDSNGQSTISLSGGTLPYTFLWDNAETVNPAMALSPGLHVVTITDANACSTTADVTIGEPLDLSLTLTGDTDFNGFSVSCNGASDGAISSLPSGGTLPYTFLWNTSETTASLTGLAAGTYVLSLTDANGCMVNDQIDLTEPMPLTAASTGAALLCFADADGNIDLSVGGGVLPYTYLWDNGAGTDEDPSSLMVGDYTVTITDNNGCTIESSASITEPTELMASATGEALLCFGDSDGNIELNVSGGTLPYTYSWDNGAGTDEDPIGLPVGDYAVTVTDNNGCTTESSASITEPTELMASATGEALLCFGDSDGDIDLTVSGGTLPYTYSWDNGAGT
ncbi:MAG: hypothetical protein AAFV80_02325, partial [Bacteroidota bacterium]